MQSFSLSGTVRPYRGDGRRLGYPTANIEIPNDTAEGTFVGWVTLRGQKHPATIFIGAPVTLNDPVKRAEAHILDFADEDLYGEEITMQVVHKLRDNFKFSSQAELIKHMQRDEQDARAYFKKTTQPKS